MANENIESKLSALKKWTLGTLAALTVVGCAGINRSCSSCVAENFATDWIVLQYDFSGKPINCWKLSNTSITNEQSSDGIYWLDNSTKNLVHISGWYNRVQVERGAWKEAAKSIGVNLDKCKNGKYLE